MKKFVFSLQKVFELKEQLLKSLKSELTELQHKMEILENDKQVILLKYNDVEIEYSNKVCTQMTVGEISYYKMFMDSLLHKADMIEEEKKKLTDVIDAKKNEIIEVNTELSSIEKLRDKKYDSYMNSLAKSEEIFIDEFVSSSKALHKSAV